MRVLDKYPYDLLFMDGETEAPHGLSKGPVVVQHWPHLGWAETPGCQCRKLLS